LFYYEEKRVPLDFLSILKHKPVIAAFRKVEDFRIEGLSNVDVLFVLGGDIFNLPTLVQQAESVKKLVFVDIDLVKGIGKDASGIRYLARESHVHGVITTKSNLINSAQKEGLISIQRIFVLDSESLTGGLNVVDKSKPDAIEVLPGLILPKIMDRIRSRSPIPVIAGGLITTPQEIQEILSSGAIGISTTSAKLLRHTIRRAR
jgi:glycerol uptake operon antiterminator